jgi:alpha-tubulin suppressor-like RCC1 family protein
VSEGYTCGVTTDGRGRCWDGSWLEWPKNSIVSISAGEHHGCVIRVDGTVECWGDDKKGETKSPPGPFRSVTVGRLHSCGIKDDGRIVCWGDDEFKQCTCGDNYFPTEYN